MNPCPVCGKQNLKGVCKDCGYDRSLDYSKYPTLAPIKGAKHISNTTFRKNIRIGCAVGAMICLIAVIVLLFCIPKDEYTYLLQIVDYSSAAGSVLTSGDESVVAVNDQGKLDIVGEGTAVVLQNTTANEPRSRLVNGNQIVLEEPGENWFMFFRVYRNKMPLSYGEPYSITSSDESVVIFIENEAHLVAVGEGTAVITITCGDKEITYTVICDFDDEPTEPDIPCEHLALTSGCEIVLEEEGANWLINAQVLPENTTDTLVYASSDKTVVTVNEQGVLTAVGEGSAVITITCGEQEMKCAVTCDFIFGTTPDLNTEPLKDIDLAEAISYTTLTFNGPNQGYTFKINGLKNTEVQWRSEDESIVTVDENGCVRNKGKGTTYIVVKYGDQELKVKINCIG